MGVLYYVQLFILFFPTSVAAKDESAFDVFTDLAPLLALFGEQFARQFMSESLTWLDHIVFAMVPLGILTAIVGAIRVSGPAWARAFIGRARETRAAAEIELMSSTSREVCEVFNGKGVVRAMGTPRLTQFILFPPSYRTDESTCGIHTLETAYCSEPPILEKGRFGIHSQWGKEEHKEGRAVRVGIELALGIAMGVGIGRTLRVRKETQESQAAPLKRRDQSGSRLSRVYRRGHYKPHDLEDGRDSGVSTADTKTEAIQWPSPKALFPAELKDSAPNLQLNLPMARESHKESMMELWYAAVTALVLQLGVLIVSAITTFHPRTRSAVGNPDAGFWFWMFIAGTVCLNFGMTLCSWVIEQSTKEHVWRSLATREKLDSDGEHQRILEQQKALQSESPDLNMKNGKDPSQVKASQISAQIKQPRQLKENVRAAEEESMVQLFWLQWKHKVNDQDFDPFLILGGRKSEILTSSRIEHEPGSKSVGLPKWIQRIVANSFELVTVLATALGVIGFILQFEGMRGLSYPTAVTQLLAILVMAFIRALVRRRLGNLLSTIPASEGHELDWLALRLVYKDGSLEAPPKYKVLEDSTSVTRWSVLTQPDLFIQSQAKRTQLSESKPNQRLLVKPGEFSQLVDDKISLDNAVAGVLSPQERRTPSTPKRTTPGQLFPPSSQMVLKVRRRLGELTNCPGAASKEAIALSQAMSLILNEFCPIPEGKKKVFTWFLKAMVKKGQVKSTKMRELDVDALSLQVNGDGSGWHVHAPDLDAVLSLWMSSFAESDANTLATKGTQSSDWLTKVASVTVKYRRILGENPPHYASPDGSKSAHIHTNILSRDLNWWTNDPRTAVINDGHQPRRTVDEKSMEKTSTGNIKLVIGFNGLEIPVSDKDGPHDNEMQGDDSEDDDDNEQSDEDYEDASRHEAGEAVAIISSGPLANILAHHLFSAFMWAISPSIPRDSFAQATVDDSDLFDGTDFEITWNLPTLRNKKMMKLARDIEAFGLGPVEDVLLAIIPPLSYRGILPNEVMMRVLLRKIGDYEEYHNWSQAQRVYLNLLQLDMDPRRMDRISYEIVVELIEFLFIAKEALDDLDDWNDNKQAKSLKEAEESISVTLRNNELLFNVARELQLFFRRQGRDKTFEGLFKKFEEDRTQPSLEAKRPQIELAKPTKAATKRSERRLFRITNFTPFHRYSSIELSKSKKGSRQAPKDTPEEWKQFANKRDIFGWCPLHYATVGQNSEVFDRVLRDSVDNGHLLHELRNKCGRTPLHYAAMYNPDRLRSFLEKGEINFKSAANVQGRDGTLPIHCAARSGKDLSIRNLDRYSNSATLDAFGRSALYIGVSVGNATVVKLLLKGNNAIAQTGEELLRRTPLHIALIRKNDEIAMELMAKEQDLRAMTLCDEEEVTPIMLLLRRGDGNFLAGMLKNFPRAVWEAEPGTSSSAAVKCFHAILKDAVCLRRKELLDTLFRHVTKQKWEDNWIFEAFSIAYQSGHLDMLIELLDSVDLLTCGNTLEDTVVLRKTEETRSGVIPGTGELSPQHGAIESGRNQLLLSADAVKTTKRGTGETQDANTTTDISSKVRNYVKTKLHIKEPAALIWALRNGTFDTVDHLMAEGLIERSTEKVPWDEKDSHNRSHLAYIAKVKPDSAAKMGLTPEKREQVLSVLWNSWDSSEKVAALNARQGSYNKTPLIYAVRNELVGLVEIFAQAGASIQGLDDHEGSAFMYAYEKSDDIREKIWNILVEHDPDVVNEASGFWLSTPLIEATRGSNTKIIEYLSKCGNTGPGESIKVDPNIGDKDGDTPLSWCIYDSIPHLIDVIFDRFSNANPHKRNLKGASPLMIAYQRGRGQTASPYLPTLLSSPILDKSGYEVTLMLSHAIFHKDLELVDSLLDAGADPYAADDAGRSQISLAALHGNLEIFNHVLAKMGDTSRNETYLELVHHACAQRYGDISEQIVAKLVKAGIEPASFDANGWSVQECKSSAVNDMQTEKAKVPASSTETVNRRHRKPSKLAISEKNPFFKIVGKTQLELKEPFPGGLSKKDGPRVLIRADHCIPLHQKTYYWELKIFNQPQGAIRDIAVAIGICTQSVNLNALPGWRGSASYGYHSDDGQIFHMTGTGDLTEHTYGQDDVVGCLVEMEDQTNRTISFTYNGKQIGSKVHLADDMRGQLYPCVGLIASTDAVGTVIQANFQVEWPLQGETRNTRTLSHAPRLQAFDEREEDAIEEEERTVSGPNEGAGSK